jgi:hypothetical protein
MHCRNCYAKGVWIIGHKHVLFEAEAREKVLRAASILNAGSIEALADE